MKRSFVFCAALATCGGAGAHGSIQGVDHFSGGLLHPLVEPTHLIALLALGLLLGQRGLAKGEAALLGFAIGLVCGLLGAAFGISVDTDLPLLAIALLTALAVALSFALPAVAYALVAALIGAGIGLASNPESFTGAAQLAALGGAGIGALLWLLCVAAAVSPLRRPWLAILVRVVGSWLCASAVLVLALSVSGRHAAAPAGPAALPARMDTTR